MASPLVLLSPSEPSKSPFQYGVKRAALTVSVSKPSPPDATPQTPGSFRYSPTSSTKFTPKNDSRLRSGEKILLGGTAKKEKKFSAAFTPSSFLTPGVVPQRRRSDQDGSPSTSAGHSSKNGARRTIRPLRASPLFSESPYFGNSQFSASKTCQALVHSPCRSENYRRQRRRLYHQDEYEDVKRKLSLPESGGGTGVFRTPKLGKGGFGSVYIGKYGGKQVAIKQLHNKKCGQGESLCAELNAFRLHHPNIVKVLTFSCSGPFVQVVFEYAGRRNLQQLLDDTSEDFEPNKRVQYCQQIADALQFCHSNRVLHLDVKPANVLVTDDSRCCKLADFGCSRLIVSQSKGADATPLCFSASTPGTLMYKAPELLRGGVATPKADVYSFGYVVWQCATRQAPFDSMNMHTIVFCVVAKNLRPTMKKEVMVKLTEEETMLVELAQRCWRQAPESRPELHDVHEGLQEYYSRHLV